MEQHPSYRACSCVRVRAIANLGILNALNRCVRLLVPFLFAASIALAQEPVTALDRWKWFGQNTLGAQSMSGGVVSAGFDTLTDQPREYGPHWMGFAQRYGMRLTGVASGNAMEAGLGAIWKEDPRYRRVGEIVPMKSRIAQVFKMTVMANDMNGRIKPAYARYLAITGNNFLSNTWRPDSEANVSSALVRSVAGVLGKLACNASDEFLPDVQRHMPRFRRKQSQHEL